MLITLDEAYRQLRMPGRDDILVFECLESALDVIERHIDKKIVLSFEGIEQELIDSEKVILLSHGLKRALLVLMTHFYQEPSLVTDEQLRVVPMSYRYILDQYRTPGIG